MLAVSVYSVNQTCGVCSDSCKSHRPVESVYREFPTALRFRLVYLPIDDNYSTRAVAAAAWRSILRFFPFFFPFRSSLLAAQSLFAFNRLEDSSYLHRVSSEVHCVCLLLSSSSAAAFPARHRRVRVLPLFENMLFRCRFRIIFIAAFFPS